MNKNLCQFQTNFKSKLFILGDDCWGCEDAEFCSEADEEKSDCGDKAAAAHYVRLEIDIIVMMMTTMLMMMVAMMVSVMVIVLMITMIMIMWRPDSRVLCQSGNSYDDQGDDNHDNDDDDDDDDNNYT